MDRVRVINGLYKGAEGILTAMLWATNTAIIETEDNEIVVRISDIEKIEQ